MGKRSRSDASYKGKELEKTPEKGIPQKHKKKPKISPTTGKEKADAPADPPEGTWSKSKKKRMRAMSAKLKKRESVEGKKVVPVSKKTGAEEESLSLAAGKPTTNSKLQEAFKARLSGSRFRILNEELYTTTSKESFEKFSKNPELFDQYHEGFRHQVESWPVNPVDVIVRWLSSKYRNNSCVVADFGCGDAQLAKDLLNSKRSSKGKSPFTVHSFDLVSPNELVTACDMANVPLENKSVDVCVFCLSLMGTNLADFIRESHRVLKDDGVVKIAEVRSRIEYSHSQKGGGKNNTNNAPRKRTEGTLEEFVDVLGELGFECVRTDRSNKMFLTLELKKNGDTPNKKLAFSAKPCIYKRR